MRNLQDELKNNYNSFKNELKIQFEKSFDTLAINDTKYLESYERLSSLEAWRAYVLESELNDNDAIDFFLEAQNDALLSHTFARIGTWRSAFQSLRSSLENTLFCLYYKDHPIEYKLWEKGKNLIPVSEFISYIGKHPNFETFPKTLWRTELLKKEYSTLSKAVHSSSKEFRMTTPCEPFPSLMIPDKNRLSQWATHERKVVQLINKMLLVMYSCKLQGSSLNHLRKSISLVLPTNLYSDMRTHLNIRLFK